MDHLAPRPEKAPSASRAAVTFLIGCVVLGVPAVYSVHTALPYNPIKLPGEKAVDAQVWGPQGWKFFTKDPQEEAMMLFVADGEGRFVPAATGPAPRPSTLFGLRREGRARGVEAGLLLGRVPQAAWRECKEAPETCLAAGGVSEEHPPVKVANPTPEPLICGRAAFALQKPVPFAWARSKHPVTMPSRFVVMEVEC
jgi:antimicrobial peptide system SdpA family protein